MLLYSRKFHDLDSKKCRSKLEVFHAFLGISTVFYPPFCILYLSDQPGPERNGSHPFFSSIKFFLFTTLKFRFSARDLLQSGSTPLSRLPVYLKFRPLYPANAALSVSPCCFGRIRQFWLSELVTSRGT